MSMDVLEGFIEHSPPKRLKGRGRISEFGRSPEKGFDWHYRRQDGVWEDVQSEYLLSLLTAPDLEKYLREFSGV